VFLAKNHWGDGAFIASPKFRNQRSHVWGRPSVEPTRGTRSGPCCPRSSSMQWSWSRRSSGYALHRKGERHGFTTPPG